MKVSLFAQCAMAAALGLLASVCATAQGVQVQTAAPQVSNFGPSLQLNLRQGGQQVHILPTINKMQAVSNTANNGGTPPLLYHGGPVLTSPTVYVIFWAPPHLQDNTPTSLSAAYQNVQLTMLKEYFGHAIANNNTQYYQTVSGKTTYIQNKGSFGGSYVDTAAYPGSDCFDPSSQLSNGNNCISDTDLQNEITKVMGIKHWTGGLNKMFLLFTSSNEGQCAASNSDCSYAQYCAYHSYFVNSSAQDVIYGNEPYGNTNVCQIPGAPSPNGNPAADAAATAASHELTEAITDPLLNAWYDSSGYEIGDECAYFYGFVGWNSGTADELWDGHPFLLQTEYSNYLGGFYYSNSSFPGCFNAGPEL